MLISYALNVKESGRFLVWNYGSQHVIDLSVVIAQIPPVFVLNLDTLPKFLDIFFSGIKVNKSPTEVNPVMNLSLHSRYFAYLSSSGSVTGFVIEFDKSLYSQHLYSFVRLAQRYFPVLETDLAFLRSEVMASDIFTTLV